MTVHAPFRFAPINEEVYFPKWGPLVSHDVPFKDGLSGEVTIEIEAKTPLLVGGVRRKALSAKDAPPNGREGEVWPFKAAGGQYAIPDSTIQGMTRSILEVAALGRLGPFVYDRGIGFRDLRSRTGRKFYQSRMATNAGGAKPQTVMQHAEAGWLIKERNSLPGMPKQKIVGCTYARIDFAQLTTLWTGTGANILAQDVDALARYKWFLGAGGIMATLDRPLYIEPLRPYSHVGGDIQIFYHKAFSTAPAGRPLSPSTVVFTGKPQPGTGPRAKKLEFVFHTPNRPGAITSGLPALPVSDEVFRDFLLIHAEQSGRKENPNWTFWKGEFDAHKAVPVFYLLDGSGNIATFGTAFMFKMAMPLTTRKMLTNSSPDHVKEDDPRMDLPSLIFGRVADDSGKLGLKRRASFDMARLCHLPEGDHPRIERAILMEPKPSYFPSYVRQPGNQVDGTLDDSHLPYATYAADLAAKAPERKKPKLAGVKVWPARNRDIPLVQQGYPSHLEDQRSIQVTLHPLPAGTRFRTTLRFHNLRPMELGAIVWALSFGEAEAWDPAQPVRMRHRMGMGKPYGLGEISVRILPDTLVVERNDGAVSTELAGGLAKAFEREMGNVPNWRNLPQMRTLFAAADPVVGAQMPQGSFDYMILDPKGGPDKNEFSKAKESGHFLPEYLKAEVVPEIGVGTRVRLRNNPDVMGTITGRVNDPRVERWYVQFDGGGKPQPLLPERFEVIG